MEHVVKLFNKRTVRREDVWPDHRSHLCYVDRENLALMAKAVLEIYRMSKLRLPRSSAMAISITCREHDPFHVALCDLLGLPVSYACGKAAGEQLTPDEHWAAVLEEHAVLAAFKFRQHHRWVLAQANGGPP